MRPNVSILIPIYNVAQYIERCADSVFSQTFEEIEYIFVNDCTPDGSIEILINVLEKYPQRKEQVKIIHHTKNKGIGTTRNTAFHHSSGRYILFIDSDDYIEKEMVELLYNKIEKENADIAVCDFFINKKKEEIILEDKVYKEIEESRKSIIEAKYSMSAVWNKMICHDLYNSCNRLPDGLNFGEDRYMMMQLYYLANKIVKIDKPLYHYVINTSSISHNISEKHFENTVLRWNLIEEFYTKHGAYDKYRDIIGIAKMKSKGELMLNARDTHLLKIYAEMFHEEQLIYFKHLTLDKKIILFMLRKKMFFVAQIFSILLRWYNKKIKNQR